MRANVHQDHLPKLQLASNARLAESDYSLLTSDQGARQLLVWCVCMALVFLGSVLRVAAVFQHNPTEILISDPGRWWHDATHLFTNDPITAIDAFGYQLWLGLFINLFGSTEMVIAAHNACLSVLTPWIWHRFLKELTRDDDIALAGWAVLS